MWKLGVTVLILTLTLGTPTLAQDYGGDSFCGIPEGCDLDGDGVPETPAGTPTGATSSSQYDTPTPTDEADNVVVVEGIVQKQDITTYQYGTHVLLGEDGGLLFALRSDKVALDDYVGERVTLQGIRVPGYQNGAVEGGPDLLEVTRIGDGSPVQPPDDEPGADAPETGDSGGPRPDPEDTAAAGVLPDTGGATGRETDGISVAALLLINAVLLGSALLVRRIVG